MGEIIDLTAQRIMRLSKSSPNPDERTVALSLLEMYMQGEVQVTYDRGEMLFKLMEPLNDGLGQHPEPPSTDPT